MARVTQEYVVKFRVINMADKELSNVIKAFAPVFGNAGRTIQTFANASGVALGTFAAKAAGVLALVAGALKVVTFAFDAARRAVSGFIDFMRQSINLGKRFQNTITLVSVAAGQSAEVFEKISLAAAGIGVDTIKAAKGFETMIRAGLTGSEAVEVFRDLALFSRAIGERMAATAQVMVGALRAFNIEAKDSKRVLDVFSFAILKTRFNFTTFSTAFAFGGAAAAGFGRDLEETVAVMARLFNMGLRASTVGTTLRNMLTRLSEPTEKARVALLRYGITMEQISPITNRWAEILANLRPLVGQVGDLTTIFGRRTAGFIAKLIAQMDEAGTFITDLEDKIKSTTGLIRDVMVKRLNTAAGQMEAFGAQWQALKIAVFQNLEPIVFEITRFATNVVFMLRKSIEDMAPTFEIFGKAIKDLAPFVVDGLGSMRDAFVKLIELIPGFGPLMAVFLKPLKSIKEFKETLDGLAASILILRVLKANLSTAAQSARVVADAFGIKFKDGAKSAAANLKDVNAATQDFIILMAKMKGIELPKNLFRTDAAKEQLSILDEEVKRQIENLEKTFSATAKGGIKGAALFTKQVGSLLNQASQALIKEGGPLGTFDKKMTNIAKKFGPVFAEALTEAAFAIAGGTGQVKDIFKRLAEVARRESEKQAGAFGISPSSIKTTVNLVEELGKQSVVRLTTLFELNKKKVLTAMVGMSSTPEARRIVQSRFEKLFPPNFFTNLTKNIRWADDATAKKILDDFRERIVILRTLADDVKKNLIPFEVTLRRISKTFRNFAVEAVDVVAKSLQKLAETKGPGFAKRLGDEWNTLGTQSNQLVKQATKASSALGDITKARLEFALKTDDIDRMREINEETVELIDNAKRLGKIFKTTSELTATSLGATLNNVLPGLSLLAKNLAVKIGEGAVKAQRAMADFRNKLKEFPSVLIQIQEGLKGGLLAPGDLDLQTAEFFFKWQRAIDGVVTAHQAAASFAQRAWDASFVQLSRRSQEVVRALGNFMTTFMGGVSQSLISSTTKFKDVFKRAIDEIKAKLLELTLIKPLFRGIFGALFGGAGGIGGLAMRSVFGMGGLPSPLQLGQTFGGARAAGPAGTFAPQLSIPPELLQHGTGMGGMGSDRFPALLGPNELVLDGDASDEFRRSMSDGGMGATFNITIQALDGASVEQVFHKKLMPLMKRSLRNNTGFAPDVSTRSNRRVRSRRFR